MHAHADLDQTAQNASQRSKPTKSHYHTVESHEAALRAIMKERGMEYVTGPQGKKFWCRLNVQFIEVSSEGEILD